MRKFFFAAVLLFNATALYASSDQNAQKNIVDSSDIENHCKKHKRCPPGPTGPAGPPGATGPAGATGATGPTGGVIGDNFIFSYQDGGQILSGTYTALTIPAANTPVVNGWTRPTDTEFQCNQTGIYLVIYRAVAANISPTIAATVSVKAEVNGTEIAGSQVGANLNPESPIANSAVLTTSFLVDATSGQILTFAGVASTAGIISIQPLNAGVTNVPTGITVTITRVQ